MVMTVEYRGLIKFDQRGLFVFFYTSYDRENLVQVNRNCSALLSTSPVPTDFRQLTAIAPSYAWPKSFYVSSSHLAMNEKSSEQQIPCRTLIFLYFFGSYWQWGQIVTLQLLLFCPTSTSSFFCYPPRLPTSYCTSRTKTLVEKCPSHSSHGLNAEAETHASVDAAVMSKTSPTAASHDSADAATVASVDAVAAHDDGFLLEPYRCGVEGGTRNFSLPHHPTLTIEGFPYY